MGSNISRDSSISNFASQQQQQQQQQRQAIGTSPNTIRSKTGSRVGSIDTFHKNSTNNKYSINEERQNPASSLPASKKTGKRIIAGRTYHANPASAYMLPMDDKEIDRLHEEHFVTKELLGFNFMNEAINQLDFQSGGLEILDVCCGPATWLCEASLEYQNCQFTGIDMSSLWPQIIRPSNVTFKEADVLQGLPFPDQTFDFIQMRFVVLAFRVNEWPFVLSEIKRVLKDGGCFQCIELDMRITTADPFAKSYTETFESFCASMGLDITAGAKLESLLSRKEKRKGDTTTEVGGENKNHPIDHHMQVLRSEYREVPLGWGGPIGDAYLSLYQGVLEGLSPWFKPHQYYQQQQQQNYDQFLHRVKHGLHQSRSYMGLYAILAQKPSMTDPDFGNRTTN
ncbi:S-adenosyl-L-methionine-dependent methyltransferase [Mycotypha africana]|uniref:S-adenosyl-L-methionine-dependent methyltransferase n=1 Tax=Mycotypha africana TaxID=64632 RepID=UPI002301B27F|nr:S-adenosyl-L-methionine-dependent methyltransferase [Mycotypha africana]KAI8979093.1 S-adenosyl-L-methionine-dependent methyltransferase [Mycotypha africana]